VTTTKKTKNQSWFMTSGLETDQVGLNRKTITTVKQWVVTYNKPRHVAGMKVEIITSSNRQYKHGFGTRQVNEEPAQNTVLISV